MLLLYQFTFAPNRQKSDVSEALGPKHYITLKAFAMALGDRTMCKTGLAKHHTFYVIFLNLPLIKNLKVTDFFRILYSTMLDEMSKYKDQPHLSFN